MRVSLCVTAFRQEREDAAHQHSVTHDGAWPRPSSYATQSLPAGTHSGRQVHDWQHAQGALRGEDVSHWVRQRVHLLQVLTVRPEGICKTSSKAPISSPGAKPNQPSSSPCCPATDPGQRWHHQGTIWWGHPHREPRPYVPKSTIQEIIYQHKSDDHLEKNDRKILSKVP